MDFLKRERERRPRRWMRAVLSGTVIVALTVSILGYLTGLLERKNSYYSYEPFFEQQPCPDVFLLGSSHVIWGLYPLELWQDYGITSYNLGSHGSFLPATCWALQSYLEMADPKLVVIDCYYLSLNDKGHASVGQTHDTFDAIPLSRNKVEAIHDMYGDTRNEFEFLWDFALYHDRWKELSAGDFLPSKDAFKNMGVNTNICVPLQFPAIDNSIVQEEDTEGVAALRKMIEVCQDKSIEVLLIYLPFPASEVEQKEANRVALIAEEYDVNYINFLTNNLINYNIDLFDSNTYPDNQWPVNGHLNFGGSIKATAYLGNYIKEHYDIPDRRDDPAYASWHEDYAAYKQYKVNLFNSQTTLETVLEVCQDRHSDYCVYLTPDVLAMENEVFYLLLENLGIERSALRMDMPTLAVVDNTGMGYRCLFPGETLETSFGVVSFEPRDGLWCVSANGVDILTADGGTAAEVTAIDPATDAVAATAVFGIRQAAIEKR